MKRTPLCWMILALVVVSMTAVPAGAFEIITEEDITQNIVTREMLIPTADNFIILYDASGSMADAYKPGVMKIDAEQQILQQQIKILPNLGYNAGLYSFTPFKAYYEMQPYDRPKLRAAIDQLPNTQTAGGFAGQPTPLAEGLAALDPILAKLEGKTVVFIFTDGTYTYNRVTKRRPLDEAKPLVDKYDVCFYLISSATTAQGRETARRHGGLERVLPGGALRRPLQESGLGRRRAFRGELHGGHRHRDGTQGGRGGGERHQFRLRPGRNRRRRPRQSQQVGAFLQENPKTYAVLAGFTDNAGDPEYNLKLSRMRAQSAKNYILEQSRIDPDRVVVLAYGATNFIADNDTPEGQAKNRRVEVAIGMLD